MGVWLCKKRSSAGISRFDQLKLDTVITDSKKAEFPRSVANFVSGRFKYGGIIREETVNTNQREGFGLFCNPRGVYYH